MNSTNIIGITYDAIASYRVQQLKTAMDAIIAAELQFMVPIIKSLLVVFVVRQFTLTWTGNMAMGTFIGSSVRAAVIVFLMIHSGTFVQYVRDPIFDKIPQAVSSTVLSAAGVATTSNTTVAQQFDKASSAADAVTAAIVAKQTGFNVTALANYLSAQFANFGIQFLLAAICAIWLLGQSLLAIILCFGPLLLGFELFDRTRGWVDQWLGKLVGMTTFGIGTSILISIQMQGLLTLLKAINSNMPPSGIQAVAVLMRVGGNMVMDLFTMAALPLICAIGSGVAASLAAPSALVALRGASAGAAGVRAMAAGGRAAAASGGRATNTASKA